MEWRLRRVVPAAAVTTLAKPHAQQQLARDLEVERAAMGQRCRPQSFGEVQRGNPQPRRWLVLSGSVWCAPGSVKKLWLLLRSTLPPPSSSCQSPNSE